MRKAADRRARVCAADLAVGRVTQPVQPLRVPKKNLIKRAVQVFTQDTPRTPTRKPRLRIALKPKKTTAKRALSLKNRLTPTTPKRARKEEGLISTPAKRAKTDESAAAPAPRRVWIHGPKAEERFEASPLAATSILVKGLCEAELIVIDGDWQAKLCDSPESLMARLFGRTLCHSTYWEKGGLDTRVCHFRDYYTEPDNIVTVSDRAKEKHPKKWKVIQEAAEGKKLVLAATIKDVPKLVSGNGLPHVRSICLSDEIAAKKTASRPNHSQLTFANFCAGTGHRLLLA